MDREKGEMVPRLGGVRRYIADFQNVLDRLNHNDRPDEGGHQDLNMRASERTTSKLISRVTLRNVDYEGGGRNKITLSVLQGVRVSKLTTSIRKELQIKNKPVPDDARFLFYAGGRELVLDDLVEAHGVIWYRLLAADEYGSWKVTLGSSVKGGQAFTDTVARHIAAGDSIGQLRQLIARHMGIQDHNRIMISAQDGLRRGLLQGDLWEARQIRGWYCRRLFINVSDDGRYIVLEGSGKRYILHGVDSPGIFGSFGSSGSLKPRHVKKALAIELFGPVNRLGDEDSKILASDIRITMVGRPAGKPLEQRIYWGHSYKFELPEALDDAFSMAESWLLAPTETCPICTDDKRIIDIPRQITADCGHKPTACKDCVRHWIHTTMETVSHDRLTCPECHKPLQFNDVKRLASREDFDRYDSLMTRAALEKIRDFRWCLSASCESGQIHDPMCDKFRCNTCKAEHCIHHKVPWHSGETCEHYDHHVGLERKREEEASAEEVKKSSNPCPKCRNAVHKWAGCNHITCVCGHEWCYSCLESYRRNDEYGLVFCRHKKDCPDGGTFADIIDQLDPPVRFGMRVRMTAWPGRNQREQENDIAVRALATGPERRDNRQLPLGHHNTLPEARQGGGIAPVPTTLPQPPQLPQLVFPPEDNALWGWDWWGFGRRHQAWLDGGRRRRREIPGMDTGLIGLHEHDDNRFTPDREDHDRLPDVDEREGRGEQERTPWRHGPRSDVAVAGESRYLGPMWLDGLDRLDRLDALRRIG